MKIKCDYCGAVFDDTNIVCPNCGGSYAENSTEKKKENYQSEKEKLEIEAKRESLEQQRLNRKYAELQLENQRIRNKQNESARKFATNTRRGCGTIFIIVAIIFVFILVIGIKTAIDENTFDSITETITEEQTTETPIVLAEGNFNEPLDTGRYTVKIDKIYKTNGYPWNCEKGHSFILFHILFTNQLDREYNSNIYCHVIADGIAQRNYILPNGYKGLPNYVPKKLTAEGWFQFDIPNDAENIEIHFGDYVICHFTWDDIVDRPAD